MRRAHFVMSWIVGAALAAFPAAPLAAEVIVFDNSDGIFTWTPVIAPFGPEATHLDITLAPTQSGEPIAHSIERKDNFYALSGWSTGLLKGWFEADGTSQVSIASFPLSFGFYEDLVFVMFSNYPAKTFAPAELIGPDTAWSPNDARYAGSGSGLLSGSVIGVRLMMDDGVHYGWIRVGGSQWAMAWAYETEPNVPVAAWGSPDADGMLHVPGEYSSIRLAINDALNGQTMLSLMAYTRESAISNWISTANRSFSAPKTDRRTAS